MVLKGMIFCCDLLPCGFNGPVCRGYGWSFVRLFLTRQKGRTQHFIWPSNNNNTVDTQPGQLSLMKRTVSPLLIPASHFSFITSSTPPPPPPSATQDNKYHNKSVNFPSSTRRQKQQPFRLHELFSAPLWATEGASSTDTPRRKKRKHKHTQPFCHKPSWVWWSSNKLRGKKIMSAKQSSSSSYTRNKRKKRKEEKKKKPLQHIWLIPKAGQN